MNRVKNAVYDGTRWFLMTLGLMTLASLAYRYGTLLLTQCGPQAVGCAAAKGAVMPVATQVMLGLGLGFAVAVGAAYAYRYARSGGDAV
jgi:hypothetical protein